MSEPTRSPKRFDPRPGIVIVLVIAVIGGGIWWWSENRHRFYPKRWGVVVPGSIYRSGQLHRDLIESTLKQHGIDVILCLRPHEADHPDHLVEAQVAAALDIELIELPLVGDGTGDLDHFVTAVVRLDQARRDGQQALVHCAAGAYRTGVVVAFYRLLIERVDPATIVPELKSYGWKHQDDDRLMDYLNSHLPEMAQRLQAHGVLDELPETFPVIRP